MPIDQDTEALVLAYLYGELPASASASFEARLAEDAELRAEVDGLMATRELLDQDVRFGEVSGLDEPPPHLYDAIIRAEALARPPELRSAIAARQDAAIQKAAGDNDQPLLSRLSTWIFGGGAIALAGAAALFIGVQTTGEAPSAIADAPASVLSDPESEAAAGEASPRRSSGAFEPQEDGDERAADEMKATTRLRDQLGGAKGDDVRRELQDAPAADVAQRGSAAPPAKAAPSRPDLDPPGRIVADSKPSARGFKEADSDKAAEMEIATGFDEEKAEGAIQGLGGAASAGAPAEAPALSSSASGGVAAAPPPAPPATKQPQNAPLRAAKSKKRAAKPAAPVPSGPSGFADDGVKAEYRKNLERRRKAAAKDAPKGARVVNEELALREQQNKLDLELEMETGSQELHKKFYDSAYTAFKRAERLDRGGATYGALPALGQMRALQGLGQHKQVVAVFKRVRPKGFKTQGVTDAYTVAARSYEALGDVRTARLLWNQVAKYRPTEATAALEALEASGGPGSSSSNAARSGRSKAKPAPKK